MANSNDTIVRVRAVVEGLPGLNQLKTAMRGISAESKSAGTDFKLVNQQIKSLNGSVAKSINNLRLQKQAFESVRNSAAIGSKAYQDATRRVKELNRELQKTEQRRGVGGRLAGLGSVAGAGFFGGPEAFLGAAAGLAFGGPGGAIAGGAIGAQVAQLRKAIGASAEYAAQIARLEIALRGVTNTTEEFATAQTAIRSVSKELNVPILEATQGFTKLQAAVRGAGGTATDSEIVFRGIIDAIKATGGSAYDVEGAILAMSQVFSKGKVSAEELQGQLGERLPGAVTLFAKATNRTLPQLAKDLEQGVVGLNDVMIFAAKLSEEYGEKARDMADSTADAGARMKVSLDDLKKDFGEFFRPVGAGIQDLITKFAELASAAARAGTGAQRKSRAYSLALEEANRAYGRLPTGQPGTAQDLSRTTAFGGGPVFKTRGADGKLRPMTKGEYLQERMQYHLQGMQTGTEMYGPGLPAKETTDFPGPKSTQTGGGGRKDISVRLANALIAAQNELNPLKKIQLEFEAEILQIGESGRKEQDRRARYNAAIVKMREKEKQLGEEMASGNAKQFLLDIEKSERVKSTIKDLEIEAGIVDRKQAQEIQKQQFINQLEQINGQLTEEQLARIDKAYDRLNKKTDESRQLAQSVVTTFARGMGDALISLIDKAQSFREVMADLLKQVGKLLINFGMQALGKGIFPDLFRAKGGPVRGRFPYIVGERGPELFMPQQSGHIIPNHQLFNLGGKFMPMHPLILAAMGGIGDFGANPRMRSSFMNYMVGGRSYDHAMRRAAGGPVTAGSDYLVGERGPEIYVPRMSSGGTSAAANVVVNVDATGSSVQGDQPNANKLGEALGAAVRAELIKQKRPGGLLS